MFDLQQKHVDDLYNASVRYYRNMYKDVVITEEELADLKVYLNIKGDDVKSLGFEVPSSLQQLLTELEHKLKGANTWDVELVIVN